MAAQVGAADWVQALRAEAAEALEQVAPGAALRWARGRGLLATDALRRGGDRARILTALAEAGWKAEPGEALLILTPSAERFLALEAEAQPRGELSRSLARFRGIAAEGETADLLMEGLKLSALGGASGAWESYEKQVRQQAALALRLGGGGGLFSCALLVEDKMKGPPQNE